MGFMAYWNSFNMLLCFIKTLKYLGMHMTVRPSVPALCHMGGLSLERIWPFVGPSDARSDHSRAWLVTPSI